MPSREHLALERSISSAHGALWRAQASAEVLGAWGLAEDLRSIGVELARVGEDLLTRRSAAKLQLVLTLPGERR